MVDLAWVDPAWVVPALVDPAWAVLAWAVLVVEVEGVGCPSAAAEVEAGELPASVVADPDLVGAVRTFGLFELVPLWSNSKPLGQPGTARPSWLQVIRWPF